MQPGERSDVTRLLRQWTGGDPQALEQLTPIVYSELRRIARGYMAQERRGHTLQPTALANEAYLRLVDVSRMQYKDRTHFFAVCAQLMRRILIERARARTASKRGGKAPALSLDEGLSASTERAAEMVALDDALQTLESLDPRKARVVELRFFGGLSVEETATVLDISPQSVLRDWKLAKVWLLDQMSATNR
jgi:RNA polymerase sigma factor (TIGR02999 family)